MQRQSLGGGSSPGSKQHHHHSINGVSSSSKEVSRLLFDDDEEETSTPMRKEEKRGGGGVFVIVSEIEEEEEVVKKKKKGDQKHHHLVRSRSEKSIHLIPILTIFCLLILYLCSYDPPLQDLAHIDGFRRISKRIDSTTTTNEINLERLISSEELDDDDDDDADHNNKGVGGDVLIRSHRSLHEILPRNDDGRRRRKWNSHRFHRKIGDYSSSSHSSSSFM